jgi:CBS domain-containing protein
MAISLAKSLRADRVSRLRLREVCAGDPSDTIEFAISCMQQRRTGCVLVQRGAELVGIFTERDFLNRVISQQLDASMTLEKVMTASPKTISVNDSVLAAVEMMGSGGYRHLPVLGERNQPIGVLSVKDVVRYLVEYFPAKVYNLPPTPEHTQPAREGA